MLELLLLVCTILLRPGHQLLQERPGFFLQLFLFFLRDTFRDSRRAPEVSIFIDILRHLLKQVLEVVVGDCTVGLCGLNKRMAVGVGIGTRYAIGEETATPQPCDTPEAALAFLCQCLHKNAYAHLFFMPIYCKIPLKQLCFRFNAVDKKNAFRHNGSTKDKEVHHYEVR